jgi:hypothetical protein
MHGPFGTRQVEDLGTGLFIGDVPEALAAHWVLEYLSTLDS